MLIRAIGIDEAERRHLGIGPELVDDQGNSNIYIDIISATTFQCIYRKFVILFHFEKKKK